MAEESLQSQNSLVKTELEEEDQQLLAPSSYSEIKLPRGRQLHGEPEVQRQVMQRTLPPDISADLFEMLQVEDRGNNLLQFLIFFAALAVILVLMWFCFPRPGGPDEFVKDPVAKIETSALPKNNKFYELEKQAEKYYADGMYVKCAQLIVDNLEEFLDDRSGQYDRLLYFFLDSVRMGNFPKQDQICRKARTAVNTVAARHRDEIKWELMRLSLNCQEFHDPNYLLKDLRRGKYVNEWRELFENGRHTLSTLEHLIGQREMKLRAGEVTAEMLDEYIMLKVFQVKILVGLWMLEGGEGKADFADGLESSPGVRWREEAWQISGEPDEVNSILGNNKRRPLEFLEIRRFILKTLISQKEFWKPCYWNGERRWTDADLQNELNRLNEQLRMK